MKTIKGALNAFKLMQNDLKDKPDDKLIEGYKRASKDYEETADEKIKVARDVIKAEIDRRGLKV